MGFQSIVLIEQTIQMKKGNLDTGYHLAMEADISTINGTYDAIKVLQNRMNYHI